MARPPGSTSERCSCREIPGFILGVPWIGLARASVDTGRIPEATGRDEEWLEARRQMRSS